MVKFTLIVPMYNVEKYIEKCLLSCLSQNLQSDEYEIILVNDGSPDKSLVIAERIARKNKNIRIISQENAGLSEARNTGINNAHGKYIWFVDSDDTIKENCLYELYDQCERQHLDLLAICAADVINDKIERRFSYKCTDVLRGVDVLDLGWMVCCAPFTIYRRTFLLDNKLKFYSGIYYEDTEFTPRSYYYAGNVGFSNEVLYFYTANPTSITRTVNPKKAFDRIKVMLSLHNFYHQNMQCTHSGFMHNYISQMYNSALLNFTEKSSNGYVLQNSEKKFTEELLDNTILLEHLKKSSHIKYRIEGFLFSLFPKYTIFIYRLMKFLTNRAK